MDRGNQQSIGRDDKTREDQNPLASPVMDEFDSYLYGLILTDGSVYLAPQNKGRISIELQMGDEPLLREIQSRLGRGTVRGRTRDTNFKSDYESSGFYECDEWFRERLFSQGMPKRGKSTIGSTPTVPYDKAAFWRGVFDGNGSNGMTANNEPFVSLTTKSTPLKEALCQLLSEGFGVEKHVNPNSRDNIYNIMLKNEVAVAFMDWMYQESTIRLDRKYEKYLLCKTWVREPSVPGGKRWLPEEDEYLMSHSIHETALHLGRTHNSVYQRRAKLRKSRPSAQSETCQ